MAYIGNHKKFFFLFQVFLTNKSSANLCGAFRTIDLIIYEKMRSLLKIKMKNLTFFRIFFDINAVGNDLGVILSAAPIRRIFANGKTAGTLYRRILAPRFGAEITVLPSTSPANAAFSLARLTEMWAALRG